MELTALERMDLTDQLSDLLVKQVTETDPLALMDLTDQIDDVLTKLGYGATDVQNTAQEAPGDDIDNSGNNETVKPETGDSGAAGGESDAFPAVVSDFMADKFIDQDASDFVGTLRSLAPFVDQYLSLDDVKTHAASWVQKHFPQSA